jgi:hypothetical protein
MATTNSELQDLERRLAAAETEADAAALGELATDDFMLVGPLGFVLDKEQWIDRRLAGVQLSPIGGPPPFAARPADAEEVAR